MASLNKNRLDPTDLLGLQEWSENTRPAKPRAAPVPEATNVADPWKLNKTMGFNNQLKKDIKAVGTNKKTANGQR